MRFSQDPVVKLCERTHRKGHGNPRSRPDAGTADFQLERAEVIAKSVGGATELSRITVIADTMPASNVVIIATMSHTHTHLQPQGGA